MSLFPFIDPEDLYSFFDDEVTDDEILLDLMYDQLINGKVTEDIAEFRELISSQAQRRRCMKISRASLLHPSMSAWAKLFGSGVDHSLITVTGLDHCTFRKLLPRFESYYNSYTWRDNSCCIVPRSGAKNGRRRLIDATACLGLSLMWFRTRGAQWSLGMHFGLTSTSLCHYIRFGRRILLVVLNENDSSRVELPTEHELRTFVAAVTRRHRLLGTKSVFGAMDGLKLTLEQAGDQTLQNMFYNGWTHDHYVTCVFLFVPDGTIVAMGLNCPGTFHDSLIADWSGIYDKCMKLWDEHGVRVCVDSAFCAKSGDFLIKSSQDTRYCNSAEEITLQREATSLRQLSEWGMRGIQGSFPRLKDRFRYEERGERRIILELAARLYNYRAREVGQNQIQSTYMPHLELRRRDGNGRLIVEPCLANSVFI